MTNGHEQNDLAATFEANRERLTSLARRILGSDVDAQDAVQEAWLRLERSRDQEIASIGAWLTTVVARVCLDVLRRRSVRGELSLNDNLEEVETIEDSREDPSKAIELADSIAVGLAIVLDALPPLERVALVLHDVFELPFEEIARVVGRSTDAARQLASRGRRRIRGVNPDVVADRERKKEIVEAFLKAAQGGDYDALIKILDPDVVADSDETIARGPKRAMHGSRKVANFFQGKAQAARVALIGTDIGLVVDDGRKLRLVVRFNVTNGRISRISATADPAVFRTAVSLPQL